MKVNVAWVLLKSREPCISCSLNRVSNWTTGGEEENVMENNAEVEQDFFLVLCIKVLVTAISFKP